MENFGNTYEGIDQDLLFDGFANFDSLMSAHLADSERYAQQPDVFQNAGISNTGFMNMTQFPQDLLMRNNINYNIQSNVQPVLVNGGGAYPMAINPQIYQQQFQQMQQFNKQMQQQYQESSQLNFNVPTSIPAATTSARSVGKSKSPHEPALSLQHQQVTAPLSTKSSKSKSNSKSPRVMESTSDLHSAQSFDLNASELSVSNKKPRISVSSVGDFNDDEDDDEDMDNMDPATKNQAMLAKEKRR